MTSFKVGVKVEDDLALFKSYNLLDLLKTVDSIPNMATSKLK